MKRAKHIIQSASRGGIRFFANTKARDILWARERALYDFYNLHHAHHLRFEDGSCVDKYHVFKFAQEQGKMSTKIKPLAPNATLEEAYEIVSGEKLDKKLEVEKADSSLFDWLRSKFR